jgi:hypothetical protein
VRELLRWPEHLPHYRFVREVGKNQNGFPLLHMSAWRNFMPVSWVSVFEADEETLELRFEHVRGWTKGMNVVWTLTPTRDGTRVEIIHDLSFRVPLLAWLAEPIIGGFFIEYIAGKTLATFKQLIEAKHSAASPS